MSGASSGPFASSSSGPFASSSSSSSASALAAAAAAAAEHPSRTAPTPPKDSGGRPELVHKLEGCSDDVNAAIIIPGENGVISGSSDRSVRVWLLRDSGQYWPSICHFMSGAVSAVVYQHDQRRLFVGIDTGMISEFVLASDFNRMDHVRDYHAHQSRVTGLRFCPQSKWLLSVSRDRYFQFHCTSSGRRLGGYLCSAWCTAIEYDAAAKYVFIGDYGGAVTVAKLTTESGVQFVNTLKGHSGSIQDITWDGRKGWLYTGSYDSCVFVWDIGGRKGTVYELHGHKAKVTCVCLSFASGESALFSAGEDGQLIRWDMDARRDESCDWADSDNCQLCSRPFFWNFKAMYDMKQIGFRQHHCRKCGRAICDSCSTKRSKLPLKGHEFPVRVCEDCFIKVTDKEREPLATMYDLKASVRAMHLDVERRRLLTVGQDHIIKIWSLQAIL